MFTKGLAEQIFWPETGDLDHTTLTPKYVDQASVQFAINTFGPWKQIFDSIYKNLEDAGQPIKPMSYFHGRTPKKELHPKISTVGDFLLRYNDGNEKGLILVWGKKGKSNNTRKGYDVILREETITRRNLKKKGVVWTWDEKIAKIGGMKIKKNDFTSIGEFLESMKGQVKIRKNDVSKLSNPVMLASAYRSFSGKPTARSEKLDDQINNVMKNLIK